MRVVLYVLLFLLLFISSSNATIYHDMDFSDNNVGQVVFGQPQVMSQFGDLVDQPLVFNTKGNTPSFFYDQIELDMDGGSNFYYTSFDIYTDRLIGSQNRFTLVYDLPDVHNIEFYNHGVIDLFKRKQINYQDNKLMHFEILMDIDNDYAKIIIDDQIVYDDKFIARYPAAPDENYLRSMRFSLGLLSANSFQDDSSSVAIDNIFVSNYVVPEPAMFSIFTLGSVLMLRCKQKR